MDSDLLFLLSTCLNHFNLVFLSLKILTSSALPSPIWPPAFFLLTPSPNNHIRSHDFVNIPFHYSHKLPWHLAPPISPCLHPYHLITVTSVSLSYSHILYSFTDSLSFFLQNILPPLQALFHLLLTLTRDHNAISKYHNP